MTKPLSLWQIIMGKYLANLMLLTALLPTLVYFFAINALKLGDNTIDWGSAITAYLGLFCVGACFVALGILSALPPKIKPPLFLMALLLCFFNTTFGKASPTSCKNKVSTAFLMLWVSLIITQPKSRSNRAKRCGLLYLSTI